MRRRTKDVRSVAWPRLQVIRPAHDPETALGVSHTPQDALGLFEYPARPLDFSRKAGPQHAQRKEELVKFVAGIWEHAPQTGKGYAYYEFVTPPFAAGYGRGVYWTRES